MMAITRIDAQHGLPFIDISREFDAPRDLVFRAHTDPGLLVQWLGPEKYEMVIGEFEARDGGRWRYIHRDPDGTEYSFHGVFHGTPTPDLMVQTFEFDGAPGQVALDTLRLEERDGRTIARIHSVYQSVEARDAMIQSGMSEGMESGYARLDALLARLVPVG